MTKREKFIYLLISLITLGIYPLILKKKSKKLKSLNNELSSATKIVTNVDKLKSVLGEDHNILGVEYTHTKIKILVKSKENIDIKKLENLKGVSGIFATSKSITLIVGNQAKELARLI